MTEGWFVVNVREAEWFSSQTRGAACWFVEKDWVGTVTPVQLFVGGSTKTVSAEPATHTVAIEAGSSTTVGETAVPANYDAFIRCGTEADVPYTGPRSLTNVTAPVTCVVTNKEQPQVKVTKDLEPSSDPGRFDLQIGGTTRKEDAGDGGTTGFVHVAPTGSLTVGEVAGDGSTDLGKYTSAVACDSEKGGSQTTSHTFGVGYGDKVSCVVTNTRKQGQVTVEQGLAAGGREGRGHAEDRLVHPGVHGGRHAVVLQEPEHRHDGQRR